MPIACYILLFPLEHIYVDGITNTNVQLPKLHQITHNIDKSL